MSEKIKKCFFVLIFTFLVLQLVVVGVSRADVVKRRPAEGYGFGTKIYPNPMALAHFVCDPMNWPVNNIVFTDRRFYDEKPVSPSPEDPHPNINIHCENMNGGTEPGQHFDQIVLRNIPYVETCMPNFSGAFQLWTGTLQCDPVDKPPPCPCPDKPEFGNPINLATAEKKQVDTDYRGSFGLHFTRIYSNVNRISGAVDLTGALQGWRHNYMKSLSANLANSSLSIPSVAYPKIDYYLISGSDFVPRIGNNTFGNESNVTITRSDGYLLYFVSSDNGNTWQADTDVKEKLAVQQRDGDGHILRWRLTTQQNDIEIYDYLGRLESIQYQAGIVHTFSYSDSATLPSIAPRPNLLLRVDDSLGRALRFEYDALGRMRSMIDPANQSYQYIYDSQGNLLGVRYPDNLRRLYAYAEAEHLANADASTFSHYLTGISDEVAENVIRRLATFKYSVVNGGLRPVSTEHSYGTQKFQFDYGNGSVTTPLGTVSNYGLTQINGAKLVSSVTEIVNDINLTRTNSYDVNSNLVSKTDFSGATTTYTYELSRNLETSRTEASGTAAARTTSTIWHPTYRIPVQLDEPLRRTTYTHDAKGNVLSKTEQATGDVNGSQGANASVVGPIRTWSYTYNNIGQVLTQTGPRTDVNDTTTYTYDAQGNLTSVTNPAGHITTLSGYDPHGHVGTITDPNGVVTQLSYHPRGWLLSRAVTADGVTETTNYTYDGVGQMIKVVLPDASEINYTYDDAHRLTKISDHLGNSINYTLDNMGNRIKEEVKDTAGNLTRQMTRVYDALNRLKEVTGGVQ